MKTLPKKIHYSGFDYEVIEVERLDGRETWGRTSFESQTIHIEKGISFQRKMQTLIHEILHIAYHHTSNVLDDKTEEDIVTTWSVNIYGILEDNGFLK